jgi:hypothetical protein
MASLMPKNRLKLSQLVLFPIVYYIGSYQSIKKPSAKKCSIFSSNCFFLFFAGEGGGTVNYVQDKPLLYYKVYEFSEFLLDIALKNYFFLI